MPTPLSPTQYLTTLRADAEKVAIAAEKDLGAAVPSCPGWDLRDLVVHLGRVHRWVTDMVRTNATERGQFPPKPEEGEDVVEWFRGAADQLVETLGNADPAAPCWNWGDGTVGFWYRRQAQETAIHRWDAQHAIGDEHPIDAALAADGIDELLAGILPGNFAGKELGNGETLHFHATDRESEWTVTFGPSGFEVAQGHGKGDAAVRGTASDLVLFAWNRIGPDAPGLETFGDATLFERWREVTKI